MPKTLTQDQVDAYRRNGYHFPVRAFSAAEASGLRAALEQHERAAGAPLQGKWRVKSHLLFTWADRIVHHPAVLDAVEDLIGPNILCWTTNFFIKEAASPGFVSYHQDAAYWGLDPEEVVTAWVALSPANLESGCMKILPGSHLESHIPHVETYGENNMLTRGQEIAVEVDDSRTVAMALEPGEMSLHHIRLVHGSAPNHSSDRRIGLAVRYLPTHVRQTKDRDSAMLVRGVDTYHHFDPEARPTRDLGESELRAHAEAVERKVAVLYQGTGKKQLPA
jgi:ectoine hydroxylase-related dioxygenase (phytanoyl-CoA dioxygenase family)